MYTAACCYILSTQVYVLEFSSAGRNTSKDEFNKSSISWHDDVVVFNFLVQQWFGK